MAATSPFRIMLTMRIHPGREAEFEQTWLNIGDGITSHPANLGQWLVRSEDELGTYFIISDWVDEASFREFELSEGHLTHRKILHPLRASGTMATGSVLAHLVGTASQPVPAAG
ncbi:antibiotic biosynthesis monooxygenase [Frankia sp. AgPm24]|uniref:Antibiotic biosynthesis monooxygenase n=1 Tax=Frankia umida TaxID=573489 RepID=A0ABT0K0V9_9ACTN|nr:MULTISPECIES: antibiotic biosynthesis monooxygenase family protein [Frankia]MCK9877445.1 antibiotic biosynthesis monooxygenase [Frankia umida]MCK9923902.1 antibiotic biosynthesis monooxygenase [Frankia sp. AgPm24]